MGRKAKQITYEFADGEQVFPASVKVKCNRTGELKTFYHSYLAKMIAEKYDNSYQKFVETYQSRRSKAEKEAAAEEGTSVEDDVRPEQYRLYLITSYRNALTKGDWSLSEEIADKYERRYQSPIDKEVRLTPEEEIEAEASSTNLDEETEVEEEYDENEEIEVDEVEDEEVEIDEDEEVEVEDEEVEDTEYAM